MTHFFLLCFSCVASLFGNNGAPVERVENLLAINRQLQFSLKLLNCNCVSSMSSSIKRQFHNHAIQSGLCERCTRLALLLFDG